MSFNFKLSNQSSNEHCTHERRVVELKAKEKSKILIYLSGNESLQKQKISINCCRYVFGMTLTH